MTIDALCCRWPAPNSLQKIDIDTNSQQNNHPIKDFRPESVDERAGNEVTDKSTLECQQLEIIRIFSLRQ